MIMLRSHTMQARKILMSTGLVLSMLGGAGLVASLPVSAQTPGTNATPPATGAAPAAKADDNAAEFDRLDKNHDGFLDKTEAIIGSHHGATGTREFRRRGYEQGRQDRQERI